MVNLPKIVTYKSVENFFDTNSLNMIIGIEKKSLDVSTYDFTKNVLNVISSNDVSIMSNFFNSFINQSKLKKSFQPMVLNCNDMNISAELKKSVVYEEKDFNGFFEKIYKYVVDCYNLYIQNNYNLSILSNQKKLLIIISGIEEFKNKLNDENKNKLSDLLLKSKSIEILSFVIFDSIDKVKKVEYDSWFKDNFNSGEGLWIGNGIDDQFTFKLSVRTDEVKESIEDDFCFVIKRGKPILAKYISDFNVLEQDDSDVLELN